MHARPARKQYPLHGRGSVLALLLAFMPAAYSHRVDIEVLPRFGGSPLAFDTLGLATPGKQKISMTRCDFLLSGAALQREDGTWLGLPSWTAYVNSRESRTRFSLLNVPAGNFVRLRFQVGVPPEINRSDPAQYPAGHPLNPLVNGLHWGWQGGYVFAALEGLWRKQDGSVGGYSYHLAHDENLMTVELPMTLGLERDYSLRIVLDLQRVFSNLQITDATATTHSRPADPVAAQLRTDMAAAFRLESSTPSPSRQEAAAHVKAIIAPGASPYRFTFSSSFPHPSLPVDNPLTTEGVALGNRLFHDTRLSGNNTQSCASCHKQENAFSDSRRLSPGAEGKPGRRQAMPLFNLAWKSSFFWDGRVNTIRDQIPVPIQDPVEMHASLPQVVKRVAGSKEYPSLFERAFGSREVNADRIARALEQFVLTLVSYDSKFDLAMKGKGTLSQEEARGMQLFNTEFDPARGQYGADCFHCHGGMLFQSVAFADNGLDANPGDPGRSQVTKNESDRGKFSVPSLRNVALTAPYMHDGRFKTLEEVVDHYDHGVQRSPSLDPNLAKHPREGLRLNESDRKALVAFLRTLNGTSGPASP